MTIQTKYQRLLSRRAPALERAVTRFTEAHEHAPGETTKYLLGALAPVAPNLTARLTEQGDRVKKQLSTRLNGEYPYLEFRRQGSVSNNTHIRYYSDVDVLTIIDKFTTLEPPQEATYPYQGNPTDD